MGRFRIFAIVLALGAGLASCDLLNVDVDTSFKGTLDVLAPEEALKGSEGLVRIYAVDTLRPGDNDEVKEYAKNIVDMQVENVDATVTLFNVDEVILTPQTRFVLTDGSTTAEWPLEEEWVISDGSSLMLEDKNDFYEKITTIIDVADLTEDELDEREWILMIDGNGGPAGARFKIDMNFDVVITGSII